MQLLRLEIENQLAVLSLNNPPQNRLSMQMLDDFEEAINKIAASDIRVLVIRGDNGLFSYGGYFPEWVNMATGEVRVLLESWLAVYNWLERLPYPVIASVPGPCWGGGFELALRCDMILATPEATFNHPEETLGITTLLGGVYRFAERAGKNIAGEMAYTAQALTAERMQQLGVVNRLVEKDALEQETMKLAHSLANGPTLAHAAHKTLLRMWAQGGVQTAENALIDLSVPLFDTEDVSVALKSAAEALEKGVPRPILVFKGK